MRECYKRSNKDKRDKRVDGIMKSLKIVQIVYKTGKRVVRRN